MLRSSLNKLNGGWRDTPAPYITTLYPSYSVFTFHMFHEDESYFKCRRKMPTNRTNAASWISSCSSTFSSPCFGVNFIYIYEKGKNPPTATHCRWFLQLEPLRCRDLCIVSFVLRLLLRRPLLLSSPLIFLFSLSISLFPLALLHSHYVPDSYLVRFHWLRRVLLDSYWLQAGPCLPGPARPHSAITEEEVEGTGGY